MPPSEADHLPAGGTLGRRGEGAAQVPRGLLAGELVDRREVGPEELVEDLGGLGEEVVAVPPEPVAALGEQHGLVCGGEGLIAHIILGPVEVCAHL